MSSHHSTAHTAHSLCPSLFLLSSLSAPLSVPSPLPSPFSLYIYVGIHDVSLEVLTSGRTRILWNFVDCVNMQFSGISVQGSVLALRADVIGNNGYVRARYML